MIFRGTSRLILAGLLTFNGTGVVKSETLYACQLQNDPEGKTFRQFNVDDGTWTRLGSMYSSSSQKPFRQFEFQVDGQHSALADGKIPDHWLGHCFKIENEPPKEKPRSVKTHDAEKCIDVDNEPFTDDSGSPYGDGRTTVHNACGRPVDFFFCIDRSGRAGTRCGQDILHFTLAAFKSRVVTIESNNHMSWKACDYIPKDEIQENFRSIGEGEGIVMYCPQ